MRRWCALSGLMCQRAIGGLIVLLFVLHNAQADTDSQLEARVMQVAEGLRCLVCQNETLAASQASLAVDLRAQIRGMLAQGQSPEEIRDYMVARYGDYVLYRPPWRASTLLLWVGPFVLLIAALVWVGRHLRKRVNTTAATLDPETAARADEWLGVPPSVTREAGGKAASQGAEHRRTASRGLPS